MKFKVHKWVDMGGYYTQIIEADCEEDAIEVARGEDESEIDPDDVNWSFDLQVDDDYRVDQIDE